MIGANISKVVILGSPNVGKSTLFNRLLGKRRSITDTTPGVTRDPIESVCTIQGVSFQLVDSGGYQAETTEDLSRLISEKSLSLATNASLILFVVDINHITANDEIYSDKLIQFKGKVILVANKADNEKRQSLIWNLHEWGYSQVIGVSAAHGRNVSDLKDLIVSLLPDDKTSDKSNQKATIKIAVLGKPNTGKSTLTNSLTGDEKSIVHPEPGTTRDVIEGDFVYKGTHFTVLDTAGMRRRSKVQGLIEHFSVQAATRSIKEGDIVFLLVDATTGITDQDKKIASLAANEGRGIILVLNKWDLLQKIPNSLNAMKDRIAFVFPALHFAPILPISAKFGTGIPDLLDMSKKIMEQLRRKISTPSLNTALKSWMSHHSIPSRGKNIKIRYAVQVSSNPVEFLFFCNRSKGIPRGYQRYLINQIRDELGFDRIPIRVEFRNRV